jgi:hypothetical protein
VEPSFFIDVGLSPLADGLLNHTPIQQIEAETARLVKAIADGQGSKSITAAIGERERELRGGGTAAGCHADMPRDQSRRVRAATIWIAVVSTAKGDPRY